MAKVKHHAELEANMDMFFDRQEAALFLFISKATDLIKIKLWSSLTKLDDVNHFLKGNNPAYSDYIKSSVKQFYFKIKMES